MGEKFSHERIRQNLQEIRAKLAVAAAESGRPAEAVKMLAATKTVDADTINFAISEGVRCIGENRVQELLEKYDRIDKRNVEMHFIGRLQTNKVKYIIDKVDLIHSVDSLRLAEEIDRQAKKHDLRANVLLEVNVGGEESKGGVQPEDAERLLESIAKLENVCVRGLMTVPPPCSQTSIDGENMPCSKKIYTNAVYFNKILKLFLDISDKKLDNIYMYELSMGMSDDYEEAVRCGATVVRLGKAIFGDRS